MSTTPSSKPSPPLPLAGTPLAHTLPAEVSIASPRQHSGWTEDALAQQEMSVEETARVLGLTTRTVINYLKSRQLQGQKVGKKWFVSTASVALMRPPGAQLAGVRLPPLEEPRSQSQVARSGGTWRRTKSRADGKGLGKLTAFARLKEAHALYKLVEHEITEEPLRQFIGSEITAIADELGGGYFHYGPTKLRLYSRARSRAGRLVARTMLGDSPDGLTWALVQMAESVAALCRRMTRSARPLGTQRHIDSGRVAVSSPSIGATESHG